MRESAAADPEGFAVLRERVFVTIVRMPLPKLQRLNRDDPFGDGFLYRIDWPDEVTRPASAAPTSTTGIHLMHGVAAMVVRWRAWSVRSCNAAGPSSSPDATPMSSTTSPLTSSSSGRSASGCTASAPTLWSCRPASASTARTP